MQRESRSVQYVLDTRVPLPVLVVSVQYNKRVETFQTRRSAQWWRHLGNPLTRLHHPQVASRPMHAIA